MTKVYGETINLSGYLDYEVAPPRKQMKRRLAMTSDTIWLLLVSIVMPFVLFFLSGANGFRRCEEYIYDFYWPLREKHPRSYVKQNAIIKVVRKCFGMQTKNNIHWFTCFLHYLQILMVISPIFMLITLLFVPSQKIIIAFLLLGISLPFGLSVILNQIFFSLQVLRCMKIKKTDNKHSKREFQ